MKTPVRVQNLTIPVTVSGSLSQISAQGSQRIFKLELIADLTELQQNITNLLRTQLDSSETCGQRVAIQQASLTPRLREPAGRAVALRTLDVSPQLRSTGFHRTGRERSNHRDQADAAIEKRSRTLWRLAPLWPHRCFGMLSEVLHSGALGEDLQDRAAQSVLSAGRAGMDFETALPPAVRNSATIQSARFRDLGVGGLSVVLDGQVEISNEQADQLASQLNQLSPETGSCAIVHQTYGFVGTP